MTSSGSPRARSSRRSRRKLSSIATPEVRVAIDGRALAAGEATGVGRYIQALVGALGDAHGVDLTLYSAAGPPVIGAQLLMPARMRLHRADVIHGPANALPLLHAGLPGVVTIHDLAIYDHPD